MSGLVVLSTGRMFAAALAPPLERRGFEILADASLGSDRPYVEVVQCTGESIDGWSRLRRCDDLNRVGYIAIVDQQNLPTYRRAYQLGASVVLDDADPELAADVIAARHAGEVRVPAGILAALLGNRTDQLNPQERAVFAELIAGKTLATVAEEAHYSERHVRRILNTVLAKAGTRSRSEAAKYFEEELAADRVTDPST